MVSGQNAIAENYRECAEVTNALKNLIFCLSHIIPSFLLGFKLNLRVSVREFGSGNSD